MDQEALALAQAAVAAFQTMADPKPTWTDTIMIIAALVSSGVGITQCWLIWFGLKRMEETGKRREKQLDQQHEESMTALRALIERTASQS